MEDPRNLSWGSRTQDFAMIPVHNTIVGPRKMCYDRESFAALLKDNGTIPFLDKS
jgi:hypothetical protein